MNKKIKTKYGLLILILIVFFTLLPAVFVEAANGLTQDPQDIPTYVQNIYQAGLMLVGVAAFIMLIYGGYLYMFGGINANTVTQAKSVIANAILGLVLLIASVLLLRTINPQLVNLTWNIWEIPPVTTNKNQHSQQNTQQPQIGKQAICNCECRSKTLGGVTDNGPLPGGGGCDWDIDPARCIGPAASEEDCADMCSDKYSSSFITEYFNKREDCCCLIANPQGQPYPECMRECQAK